jgi:hypothetical protein
MIGRQPREGEIVKGSRAALLAALALAACVALGTATPAGGGQSEDCFAEEPPAGNGAFACSMSARFEFEDQLVDGTPCLAEPFVADGYIAQRNHYVFNENPDGSLDSHQDISAVVHFAGVGTVTGAHYVYHGTAHQSQSWDFDGDANHDTITQHAVATGPGQANKLVVHFTTHQTVDATGRYHLSIVNAFLTCGDETDHIHINPSNTDF